MGTPIDPNPIYAQFELSVTYDRKSKHCKKVLKINDHARLLKHIASEAASAQCPLGVRLRFAERLQKHERKTAEKAEARDVVEARARK
jgi:hypothetical protein